MPLVWSKMINNIRARAILKVTEIWLLGQGYSLGILKDPYTRSLYRSLQLFTIFFLIRKNSRLLFFIKGKFLSSFFCSLKKDYFKLNNFYYFSCFFCSNIKIILWAIKIQKMNLVLMKYNLIVMIFKRKKRMKTKQIIQLIFVQIIMQIITFNPKKIKLSITIWIILIILLIIFNHYQFYNSKKLLLIIGSTKQQTKKLQIRIS